MPIRTMPKSCAPSAKAALFAASALASLVLATSPALAAPAPERFAVGTNANGDSCSAARNWSSDTKGVQYSAEQPYLITCRDIAAADVQGYISPLGKPADTALCGAALSVPLAGIGPAEIRRCFDTTLGRSAIDIRFTTKSGRIWQGASLESATGTMEAVLRVVALGAAAPPPNQAQKPTFDLASVPAGGTATGTGGTQALTASAALADGVVALQTGRLLDASRTLTDALRAFASADISTRIDLRLASGLANSNLSQFELAQGDFAMAAALLDQAPPSPRRDQQMLQVSIYQGLDLINQHAWSDAIAALTQNKKTDGTLDDPVTLSRLNDEAARSGNTLQAALSDQNQLTRSLLEAQRFNALSTAYLGSNRIDEASQALRIAVKAAQVVVARYAPDNIVWLRTMIERQQARILMRRGGPGAASQALVHLNCAVNALSGSSTGGGCLFPDAKPVSDTFQNAPLLADTRLERASIASRDPSISAQQVLANYRAAVESLPQLTGTGYVSLAALERYFVLLTKADASPARDEEFFRAMQMVGEPAIAREYTQLQKVISADGKIAELLRKSALLNRQLVRLRTEIANVGATSGPAFDALEKERQEAENERERINSQLLADNRIGALQDEPATISEIREALAPGEVYLKLALLKNEMAGIVIGRDKTWIYMVDGGASKTEKLADAVLTSARVDEATRTIRPFQVSKASKLFQAITGPAASAVATAQRINYNPAGKLRQLPLAVLVSDPASAAAYEGQRAKGDYSKVTFLSRTTESDIALSPRAFLRTRKEVTPSNAPGKFLGIGENAMPEVASGMTADSKMPFDCAITYGTWANYLGRINPISSREIGLAAAALGADNPPEIVRGAFTDTNLLNGSAGAQLDQYQVLHFATHGLPETQVDLPQCRLHLPPALLTTLAAPSSNGQVLSDGLLSFDEVAKLNLNANLVVLSACDTGAGASTQAALKAGVESSSPALDGLVRSFITARARAVLATFWAVPVLKETDELMARFYSEGRTAGMAKSLRVAQNQMIDTRRYSHPYYWGAYFLVGDGGKMMLTPVAVAQK